MQGEESDDEELDSLKKQPEFSEKQENEISNGNNGKEILRLINIFSFMKCRVNIRIVVKDFVLETIALFDTGADSNCIKEDLPHAFWKKKEHIVDLPYETDFKESQIPTKARPIQMNEQLLQHYQKEIKDLLDKGLIRPSKSPWSCTAFYVNKQAEIEQGTPRLVINYKPLDQALQWIRYPIPTKRICSIG
ncbi:uncharacterized protein LOC107607342 [Arachis ipaensis]|uniref:uncharacterized protein LOC107607342 n=1 Tax=Arachis ipaensis TaxID=130454 RepID=UPI0007AFBAE1|nr:uncharacterized protein LOC107607342 [Arachis ipaensis]XP_025664948.1 uncharacterized protein LOC112763512 [Arachis hypogaea]